MWTKELLLCALGLWSIGTGAAGQSRQPTSSDPSCRMIALLDASASGGFQPFILGDPSIDATPGRTWRRYPAKVAVPVLARAEALQALAIFQHSLRLSPPMMEQVRMDIVPTRNRRHNRAKPKALLDDPRLLRRRPTTPTFWT